MTKEDRYLATGFREVGAGGDSKLSRCLEFMQNMPCFQRYKGESLDCLQLKLGRTTIDVGCGLGADAFSMAQIAGPSGLSIGIDNSKRLVERALEIYATHCCRLQRLQPTFSLASRRTPRPPFWGYFVRIWSKCWKKQGARPRTACRDPKDDKFLSLAVSGLATHIVTGDADLLALHPFQGIQILTPGALLEQS
jgi:hypothetical protein